MFRSRPAYALASLCLLLTGPAIAEEPSAPILVRVTGAEPGVGFLSARLYDNEDDFLEKHTGQERLAPDENGAAVLSFGFRPAGEYAVTVYWDEDGDGAMKTGFLGIPKEKVGFSNNAKGRFGPAKWKAASFRHTGSEQEITINLVSAKD